jgi:hypothetical protein
MYQHFCPSMDNNPNSSKYKKSTIKFARAYIPRQPYIGMFPLNQALKKGTLFPNLYVPYPIKSME